MMDSCRSRRLLVVVLGALSCIGASYWLRSQPIPMIGILVLITGTTLIRLYPPEGRAFWTEFVPLFASSATLSAIPMRWFEAALLFSIGCTMAAVLIFAIWLTWRHSRSRPMPPHLLLKVTRVQAPELAGVVEYDSLRFSAMRVEECSDDWKQQLSQVTTDENGRFTLPHVSDDLVHCVRVSLHGAKTVHLYVELSADARPLLVRLKPARYLGAR